jgi:tetratricopeptide (TPR) repeat protein/DNA-binding SARP family transcriptional activator
MVSGGDGAGRVRFELLGPFAVLSEDRPVEVEGATARAVLVALLLRPGGYAGAGQLISAVWGEPDGTSEDNLYHHISRLRRVLAPLGLRIGPGYAPKVRYRLPVPYAAVDVRRFEQLLASAAALGETEPEEALSRLRAALSLWRGPAAFPELPLPGVRALGYTLDITRLDAEERLAALELRLGRPEQLVTRLRALTAEHPGHAGVTAALIRTLHATGRIDEAEQVYRRAGQRHGQRLPAKVEQAYRDRPGTDRQPGLAAAPAGWEVPDQIPAAARYFTGREEELARLVKTREPGAGAAVVLAVNGMPGVGKTALVLQAAHQMVEAGRFPDGALFVELRGFSGQTPTDPAAALDALLRGLGVPGAQIPSDADACASLYRTVVARRRVLIVLDNARDEAQVRPLVPGTANSLVLVTSRRRLAGLDDADQINIDILPLQEAGRLFRAMVAPRHPGDEQTIEEIVLLCGLLPLAVRIAGARLKTTRALTGHRLLAQLRTEQGRLAALDDGERSVAAALAVSYRHLPAEQQRAFAVLGLHPGMESEPHATAALLDTSPEHAQRLLDALEQVNLVDQPTSGRYKFHDLIRVYAATTDAGTDMDRRVALGRLYDHYAHAASTAMDLGYPYEADQRPVAPFPRTAGPALADEAAALTWLNTELHNLLAAAHHAAEHGRPDHTTHQSTALHRHLRTHGEYNYAHTLHQRALDVARTSGNTTAELDALTALGYVHSLQGRYGPATTCLARAVELARATANLPRELDALNGLGEVYYAQGAHGPAADCHGQALELARATGNRPGELNALNGLGYVHYLQGRFGPAADRHGQALGLARATGNRPGELNALTGLAYVDYGLGRHGPAAVGFERVLELARSFGHRVSELNALTGLGHAHRLQGRYGPAADYYTQVLDLARATGDRVGELNALTGLGHAHRLQGRYGPAADCYTQVVDLARAIGERNSQFEGHLGLGRTRQVTGDPHWALSAHLLALDLARDLGQRPDEVRALSGLAHAHRALGQRDHARKLWQDALQILADLDTSAAEDVSAADIRASLADLDRAPTA